MANYSEKLRDPRWQKRRLEIMQRDKFTCQICLDDKSTLNVHHLWYRPGADPWDYENTALITLCENCHQFESENRAKAEGDLLEALRVRGAFFESIVELSQAITHMKMPLTVGETFHYLADLLCDPERLSDAIQQQRDSDPDVIAARKAWKEIDAKST
jgi:hypothetical protein